MLVVPTTILAFVGAILWQLSCHPLVADLHGIQVHLGQAVRLGLLQQPAEMQRGNWLSCFYTGVAAYPQDAPGNWDGFKGQLPNLGVFVHWPTSQWQHS